MEDRRAHWDSTYRDRPSTELGWYRAHLEASVDLIRGSGVSPRGRVIDVGGGASTLVDDLLAEGFDDLTVLDLSAEALGRSRARLGALASRVRWVEADILEASLGPGSFDLWHDRAAFHFLVDPIDRQRYVEVARRSLRPGGRLVVGTFALDGPARCSGLEVARYSPESLARAFGEGFAVEVRRAEGHQTPSGKPQPYAYVRLVRVDDDARGGSTDVEAAGRVVGLYDRHADAWDRARTRGPFVEGAWLDRFLALMPPGPRVLDLGCGAGEPVARHLIGRGCRLTGVDASPRLVEMARGRFPGAEWVVGDLRALPLGPTFDGLLAWDSSFHLGPDDQRGLFGSIGRHANPSAALMFTAGPRAGESTGTFEGEPLFHASLGPDEYRQILARQGFREVAHAVDDPTCGGRTVWLGRRGG